MTYSLKSKQCTPNHPKDKSGVCLVVGTHPNWKEDLIAAESHARNSGLKVDAICAVNDATNLVTADYLVTCHSENLVQFLEDVGHEIEIHTRKKDEKYERWENQYVWPNSYGAGSSLFAAATMVCLGFDLVIMCGCPMNGMDGYAVKSHNGTDDSPRLGEEDFPANTLNGYHRNIQIFKDECDEADKIRSMSGVTKQIFGGI